MAFLPSLCVAQSFTRDAEGNFHAARPVEAAHDSSTTFTYTYKSRMGNESYTVPVFKTARGVFYAWRLSAKTGRQYRVYLREGSK